MKLIKCLLVLCLVYSGLLNAQINPEGTGDYTASILPSGAGDSHLGTNTDCVYANVKVNEATGSTVKKMEWELLLNHFGAQTKDAEKSDVDDSFAAYAHLVNYNNKIILYIRMEILSSEARTNYGNMYEGDKLLFKLGNDEVISIESGKSEIGNVQGAMTSYSVFYPISNDALSKLKEQEIDKVRIHWSNGYMDYQVTNNDFFIRQLSCVK